MTTEDGAPEPQVPSGEAELTPAAAPAPAESFFDRLVGVLTSPGEAFARIAKSPTWLGILVVLAVVGSGASWITYSRIPKEEIGREVRSRIVRTMEKFGGQMPESQLQEIVEKEMAKSPLRRSLPRLAVVVIALFIGATYYFLVYRAFGSDASYKQVLSFVAWGSVPGAIKTLLVVPIVLMKTDLSLMEVEFETIARTSVGSFLDPSGHPFLWGMLLTVDLFVAWTFYLRVTGGSKLPGVSKGLAIGATVVAWLFTVALAGVGALFST